MSTSPSIRINDELADPARVRAEAVGLSLQGYVNRLVAADVRGQNPFEVLPVGLTTVAKDLEDGVGTYAPFILLFTRHNGQLVVTLCAIRQMDRTTLTVEITTGAWSARVESLPRAAILAWQKVDPQENARNSFTTACARFRAFGAIPYPEALS